MDNIANLISNIQIALNRKLKFINCRKSNKLIQILKILQEENIILGFIIGKNQIKIFVNLKIKYLKLKKISKLNNKVFIGINKLKLINQGAGISILSTTKGMLSDIKAKSLNLGGELVFQVFWI